MTLTHLYDGQNTGAREFYDFDTVSKNGNLKTRTKKEPDIPEEYMGDG